MNNTFDDHSRSGERPSIAEMLTEISGDVTTLVRQELELAKAEVRQSATRAGRGAAMLTGAGVSGHLALLFVSIAAWWGIGNETGRGWAGLIVAAVWLVIGGALALAGKREISAVTGAPQTADTVKKIPSAVAGHEEIR